MNILRIFAFTFLLGALRVFLMVDSSFQAIGTPEFDITRWLDADYFLISSVFKPLFYSGVYIAWT
ncbi:hypothetical protein G7062_02670 [Erysipelothrix sp. HDW6C]|uniref:hypothetical protein n=1 Tax=Erysipelothrix sp. HDW6C TaxID=2714930 RepID=UPI00140883F5|nr:hypothetical protein [Erysipelothrix sp. HDW6C]QIK69258.1 hypothetical protein G7062_02670 [Erysipelothrix sp. HDW6C]